jgi:XTP/dITP diphosphohydrolase
VKSIRVASTNPGKLRELREMLQPLGISVRGVDDLPGFDVVEDGDTFEANALKKAQALVERTGEAALGDDSGLVVDALGGRPGVHSARYSGVAGAGKDAANRRKLLAELAEVPEARRTARFVCVLAYCEPGREPRSFRGEVEGHIGRVERGTNGFGYDSLFIVEGGKLTAAELEPDAKHAVSHRGRALAKLLDSLARP